MVCWTDYALSYWNKIFKLEEVSYLDIFIHFPINFKNFLEIKIIWEWCLENIEVSRKILFSDFSFFDKILIILNYFLTFLIIIFIFFAIFKFQKYIENNLKNDKISYFSAYWIIIWIIILIYFFIKFFWVFFIFFIK